LAPKKLKGKYLLEAKHVIKQSQVQTQDIPTTQKQCTGDGLGWERIRDGREVSSTKYNLT
jgi:hypothetical protein